MRRLVLLLAACSPAPDHKLPGASITPHLAARPAPPACGDDVAWNGDTSPDVRYLYGYDEIGRLTHITGAFAAGGPNETIDYAYDNLGRMTHQLDVNTGANVHAEVTANYDTLGDLLDYTYDTTSPQGHDGQHYVMSAFNDNGQPTRQVLTPLGQPDIHYDIAYDASGRIAFVVTDGGQTTTYSYDDEATRTVTIDTDNGAFHGVIVYDDANRELSEDWDGTAQGEIASETLYDYAGPRMRSATFKQGTQQAPHTLTTLEVDTLRYDCR